MTASGFKALPYWGLSTATKTVMQFLWTVGAKLVMTAPLVFRGIILGHVFLKTIKVLRSNSKHFWTLTDRSCPCVYKASSYSHTSWNIQARHISQENLNFSRLKTTAYVTPTTLSP